MTAGDAGEEVASEPPALSEVLSSKHPTHRAGRTGLLIVWSEGTRERRWVVEYKLRRGDLERTIAEGLEQTRAYLDRCGAEAGHLIVFDRSTERRRSSAASRRPAQRGSPSGTCDAAIV